MTERISNLRRFFIDEKKHHSYRQKAPDPMVLASEFSRNNTPDVDRAVIRLKYMLDNEVPVVLKDEKIALMRTIPKPPEIFTEDELNAIKAAHRIHERGEVCNINVNYSLLLDAGFDKKRREIAGVIGKFEKCGDISSVHYLRQLLSILDSVEALAGRYRKEAEKVGNRIVAESFSNIPANPPANFLQALQMLRLLHFTMWCGNNYHNTLGRFDQYMFKYLKNDMEKGLLDYDSALELVEEFFLSLNRDSDLYPGMQQGDNGQSLVLGGLNEDGSDSFNILSEICLKASLELKLIDPKINLRVSKNTPIERYILGTQLTKQGLGFPQYSNDDVVIDGLINLGYDKNDAYNYVVAACWEFIIPGRGMDIPNIDALSFVKAVEDSTFDKLKSCKSFDEFFAFVKENINSQADEICNNTKNIYIFPAPFLSLMMEGCVENAKDISHGNRYNNYGVHGTGISTAVDSLAAIKKYVFEKGEIKPETLVAALKNNFKGFEDLRNKLRYNAPKFGNDDEFADNIAVSLLDAFAQSLQNKKNGSAMYYIWHSKDMPATPDGRNHGEEFPANYSPSMFARLNGPVSIIKSFAKPDLKKVINGGPLTLELHDTVFRTPEAVSKVALLVKSFMDLGGNQLQLNSVNRDILIDAQKNPEKHRNLIVRVWGWSGYFTELSKEYQDHIIKRAELSI